MKDINEVTVQIKVREYDEKYFRISFHDTLIPKKICTVVPPVEQQEGEPERTPVGTYEGQSIYEDTKAWYVMIHNLTIIPIDCTKTINEYIVRDWPGSEGVCSKVYLTPEEANKRLRQEVEKKALDYKFSISECIEATQNSTPLSYAIKQIEKEYQSPI